MTGQQLKNSILQLAIEGRLVAQCPTDEPASALLQRIRQEKQALVKAGTLKKKDLTTTPITDDEKPFDIPESWEWCRLEDILEFVNGRAYKKEELLPSGKYKVLRVGNFFTNESWYYSNLELEETKYCHKGDLLYAWSASFGPHIWEGDKTIFHYHIWNVRYSKENLYREYLYYFFLNDVNIIRKSTTGSTMVHVSMENMKPRLIPLPPLAEQRRIVARIEELMPLVEQYGKAQGELEALNAGLPEALKKSILQEAIQGRLVPQCATDEPASTLLQRIRREKEQLVKAGTLKKKDLTNTPITDDEKPFDIPEGWEWCRLGELMRVIGGTSYSKSDIVPRGIRILRGGNIQATKLCLFDDDVYVSETLLDSEKNIMDGDTIIVASTGSFTAIGKPAFINGSYPCTQIGAFLRILRPYNLMLAPYIRLIFMGDYYRSHLLSKVKGTNINNIKAAYIEDMPIPLPPLAEQRRIVAKIEELFALL